MCVSGWAGSTARVYRSLLCQRLTGQDELQEVVHPLGCEELVGLVLCRADHVLQGSRDPEHVAHELGPPAAVGGVVDGAEVANAWRQGLQSGHEAHREASGVDC